MEYKLTKNKVRAALGFEIKLAQMMLADGITTIEAESFEAGFSVGIVTEDGIVPLPVGDYELEDGKILKVEQDGVIASIEDAPMAEEMPEVEPAVEVEVEAQAQPQPKRVVESISKETFFAEIEKVKAEFASQLESIKAENEALKAENESLKKVELSEVKDEEPAVEPIIANPEKENNEVFAFGQSRVQTIQDKVFEKLFN